MDTKHFTVWVGGVEVNNSYLTQDEAEALSSEYIDEGYDDVLITEII